MHRLPRFFCLSIFVGAIASFATASMGGIRDEIRAQATRSGSTRGGSHTRVDLSMPPPDSFSASLVYDWPSQLVSDDGASYEFLEVRIRFTRRHVDGISWGDAIESKGMQVLVYGCSGEQCRRVGLRFDQLPLVQLMVIDLEKSSDPIPPIYVQAMWDEREMSFEDFRERFSRFRTRLTHR